MGIAGEEELRDGFPKSAEELFAYDAVIIDDLEASFFSPDQMSLLHQYVNDRGGGLMMLAGQESFIEGGFERTRLGELLPVYVSKQTRDEDSNSQNFAWNLTREGLLQPWARTRSTDVAEKKALAAMPPFRTLNRLTRIKPGASWIAEVVGTYDDRYPALATQRFGKGRTAALLIGDMWRWSLTREHGSENDLAQFWRQTTRWLVADVPRRVEIEAGKFNPTEAVTITVNARNEEYLPLDNQTVQLSIIPPDGEEFRIDAKGADTSGSYVAKYWPRAEGCYQVTATVTSMDGSEVGTVSTGWVAEPASVEFESLVPAKKQLELLAERTGGEVVPIEELDRFVKSLPNRKVPVTEAWIFPLWHHPSVLAFVIVCLCGEWGLRRWKGLP